MAELKFYRRTFFLNSKCFWAIVLEFLRLRGWFLVLRSSWIVERLRRGPNSSTDLASINWSKREIEPILGLRQSCARLCDSLSLTSLPRAHPLDISHWKNSPSFQPCFCSESGPDLLFQCKGCLLSHLESWNAYFHGNEMELICSKGL